MEAQYSWPNLHPTRKSVELKLIDLLDGRIDRDAASAWAKALLSDPDLSDEATKAALASMVRVNAKDESDDFQFDKEEIRSWLEALRASPKESFPARPVVERKLDDLLEGRITPSEAAAWAWPLVANEREYPAVTDLPAWDAVKRLAMCDSKDDRDHYAYDKVSFRAWREELRASSSKIAGK